MFAIPIILLHGMGSHPMTLLPLELYLNYLGYVDTYKIAYETDYSNLDELVTHVNSQMLKCLKSKNKKIIIIGQSLGGVVANKLHEHNWNIHSAIYIGSPLGGAYFLNQLESTIPSFLFNYIHEKPFNFLKKELEIKEPPHKYHTISMGWFYSYFDGCVYKGETSITDAKHSHFYFSDHRIAFADPRIWYFVGDIIQDSEF